MTPRETSALTLNKALTEKLEQEKKKLEILSNEYPIFPEDFKAADETEPRDNCAHTNTRSSGFFEIECLDCQHIFGDC